MALHAHRLAHLERWSNTVTPLINNAGGPDTVAALLGTNPVNIRHWMAGEAIPYTRTIVKLAETIDVPTGILLEAAGRPPIVELRATTAKDHDTSLPGMLCAYRDRLGGDTEVAATTLGVNRWTFSRLANGSVRPLTLKSVHTIAVALDTTMETVLRASAYGPTHPLTVEYHTTTTGFAGLVRTAIETLELDSWDDSHLRVAATMLRVDIGRLTRMLDAQTTANVIECQTIAKATGADLVTLLESTGIDSALAAKFADALPAARKIRCYDSPGDLLRAFRIANDITLAQATRRAGYKHHAALIRIEQNTVKPNVTALIRWGDAVNAPLPRLIAAAGLAA